jgi:dynein heavy chain
MIKLGDNTITYDLNFMMYMVTKMPNPHYLPESFIRVSVINFTVTQEGLVQQLLAEIVKLEKPEIEIRKQTLTEELVEGQKQIKKLEDDILEQLVNSGDNVLDDEDLI